MNRIAVSCLGAVCALTPAGAFAAAADAYAPLKLYEGRWNAVSDQDGKTTALENHCARTGLFFACEQVVNGKSGALIVFLPQGRTAAGQTYRTEALTVAAETPGAWASLTIDASHWVYTWNSSSNGKPIQNRNVNQFSGPDKIHFDVQSSTDGKTWTTRMSGEERRIP